jgi:RNA polymerase sigma-70 factor (ECF subfamily)
MDTCTDVDLLTRARRLDRTALAELYDRYSDGIYYFALRLLGDVAAAEDCASQTFCNLLHALREGGGPTDNMRAYLYRSAHNWIVDYFRRIPPLPLDPDHDLLASAESTSDEAEHRVAQERVRRALRLLTPEQREVVTLRFIEGWELAEIAVCMSKPLGAVKALQHRGVAALRTMLLERERSQDETRSTVRAGA